MAIKSLTMEITFFDKLPFPLIEKISSYLTEYDKCNLYDIYYKDVKILRSRIIFEKIKRCNDCLKQRETFLCSTYKLCLECIRNKINRQCQAVTYRSMLYYCDEKENLSKYLLENSKIYLLRSLYYTLSIRFKLNSILTNTKDLYIDWTEPYKALKQCKLNFVCLGELMKITRLSRKQVFSHFKVFKIKPTKKKYSRTFVFHSHYFLFNTNKILKYMKENI